MLRLEVKNGKVKTFYSQNEKRKARRDKNGRSRVKELNETGKVHELLFDTSGQVLVDRVAIFPAILLASGVGISDKTLRPILSRMHCWSFDEEFGAVVEEEGEFGYL